MLGHDGVDGCHGSNGDDVAHAALEVGKVNGLVQAYLQGGVLHTAYRDHKIKENPNGFLDRIDTIPTEKEHLSQQELVELANTDCKELVLKKALSMKSQMIYYFIYT